MDIVFEPGRHGGALLRVRGSGFLPERLLDPGGGLLRDPDGGQGHVRSAGV